MFETIRTLLSNESSGNSELITCKIGSRGKIQQINSRIHRRQAFSIDDAKHSQDSIDHTWVASVTSAGRQPIMHLQGSRKDVPPKWCRRGPYWVRWEEIWRRGEELGIKLVFRPAGTKGSFGCWVLESLMVMIGLAVGLRTEPIRSHSKATRRYTQANPDKRGCLLVDGDTAPAAEVSRVSRS